MSYARRDIADKDLNMPEITAQSQLTDRHPHDGVRSSWRVMTVAILIAAAGLGCASATDVEPLSVTLTNLEFTDVTVFETTLVAKLRITNPNPEAFEFEGASFTLYLEGKKVGTGTSPHPFTAPRLDSSLIDVTFHINNASALLRLKTILANEQITYSVRGTLFTAGSFGGGKIKVEREGTLDLDEMPGQTPRIDELNELGSQPRDA